MKVALISTPSTSGKTVLSFLLGCTWAKVMKTKSYHMTTGTFDEYFNLVPDIDVKMRGKTRELRTALRSASVESAESFATSFTTSGNYPVCEFTDPSSPEEKAEVLKGFAALLPSITSLVLVEINNNADLEDNIAVINACNVALVLCRPIMGEYDAYKKILEKYKVEIPAFPLLTQLNPLTVTKKELDIWFPEKYFTFSYNPAIQKFINKRKADMLIDAIIKVDFGTQTIRQELHNILARIYHPTKIPEVSRWS